MGQVGFGSYRISIRSAPHREALTLALKLGCPLIDTSANYTSGESEELIGAVLAEHPESRPKIVTKAGYIQGPNIKMLEELNSKSQALDDLVDLGEDLKHSIHPDFLRNQIDHSLKRLKCSSVDTFLLHNPEYYFKTEGANQEEYYRRIKKAFEYLEEEVQKGRIKQYGISSNHFILPINHPEVTDLNRVLEISQSIASKNSFGAIQFPLNLIEIGALEKHGDYGEQSLLELAQFNGLMTMSNRPLNAFVNNQLVRLATYEFLTNGHDEEKAQRQFEKCMSLIEEKWNQALQDDQLVDREDFGELVLIKQFVELWRTLPTIDAVEQVYFGHLFPFIARIWGGNGLSAKEAAPFYELLEHSYLFARKNMTNKALHFKSQAQGVGIIPAHSTQALSVEVIETYLNYGIDFVLLGMKNVDYVNQVKHLF